jgi:streptomycin 6-kinase
MALLSGTRKWDMPDIRIPTRLAEYARRDPSGRQVAWIDTLPGRIVELADRWSLTVREPFEPGGVAGWVAPARSPAGDTVLKVAWRHYEAEHEAEGLRVWNGAGAVRLYECAEYDDTIAMLLERCAPGTPLSTQPEADRDPVIASLLQQLWIQPPGGHPFRPLQKMCADWADEFDRKRPPDALDAGLVRAGMELFRTLPANAKRNVLLCTDLHADNVLQARREPWLVIDPKPYVGDPTYDPVQHMLNCEQRLHTNPRALVQRMAGLLDLDAERLGLWLFARCVEESPEWPRMAEVAMQLAP